MIEVPIQNVRVAAYEVPTEQPESDRTLAWHSVTLVLVELDAGGETGIGYTYADQSAATLVSSNANGAYQRKQALAQAKWLGEHCVAWFEEPVSSNDLAGLRLLRDQGPPGMAIAAGEYGYEPGYFRRMLEAGAVDVLQADATRCCGITGMQTVAALCTAHEDPFSAHCALAINALAGCAVGPLLHCEYSPRSRASGCDLA